MSASFTFPKSARLLNSRDYSQVFDNVGCRVSSHHFLILCRTQTVAEPRMGVIVAKKNVKLAVQRNRIKRLLRESFRNKRDSLPSFDFVVLCKKGLSDRDNKAIDSELNYLWHKLIKKVARN